MSVNVEKNRCPANHRCPSVSVCPTGALVQKGFAAPEVIDKLCINCGKCIRFCPYKVFSTGNSK
ncbi:MAG TPA: 4Fe-4S binding protein [bacterium]|nr:4Fe-4S binding protein [bacterium]HPS31481.1 4Fe-4S binding protein [bacterium]